MALILQTWHCMVAVSLAKVAAAGLTGQETYIKVAALMHAAA